MALGYDYLTFNSTALPWAKKNQTKFTHMETVGTSEAGYDLAITNRLNKPTYSYSFRVTSYWRDTLKTICALTSGTLYINGDGGHTVRPRMQSCDLVQDSELTEGTDGLYDISITFYER